VNYSSADFFALPYSPRAEEPAAPAPAIERFSSTFAGVSSDMGDGLMNAASSCFCGTCASLAQGGFELIQFSRYILNPSFNTPEPSVTLANATTASSS
jgi:hypothetical protein